MKLSFTTLGCPDWDLETIIARAKEYGYDGVDFRGLQNQLNIYELPEFSTHVTETRQRFADANLEVSCFSSSVGLFNQADLAKNIREIEQYAHLCNVFQTKYIRVFGKSIGMTARAEAVALVVEHLQPMVDIAKRYNVKLLIETHDDWTACEHVKAVMEKVDQNYVGVLWDIHHPYRTLGEQPETTWQTLGKWIDYTHWKDSIKQQDNSDAFDYCLMGQGDIPFPQIYKVLQQNHYEGWFTFEWEKKWHPELEAPEISFPHYVQFMRTLSH